MAPGKFHSVPSRDECRACHDSGRTEILGFTALQLSTDRDPLAPHAEALTPDMVTLRSLVDERRLQPAAAGALVATPPRIAARDARERAVLGYLSTNCGSCHNPKSSIASLGLFLQHAADRPPPARPTRLPRRSDQPGTGWCPRRRTAPRSSCTPDAPS